MGAYSFIDYHARRAKKQALTAWRASSVREVNLPPHRGVGVGNMFGFWMWAHARQATGEAGWVRRTAAMSTWTSAFPRIEPLLIDAADIRCRDRRNSHWYQEFDCVPYELRLSFITDRLLVSPNLRLVDRGDEVVTVNVRRGDYYSDPKLRAQYGFDISSYLRSAMEASAAQGSVAEVHVVTDDPSWCRAELSLLQDYGKVRFQAATDGPLDNLAQLASARRLVLANSSFSYWAAYMSNALYGNNHANVWAPTFHCRTINYGRAWQLDPRWSVVDNAPSEMSLGGDARG